MISVAKATDNNNLTTQHIDITKPEINPDCPAYNIYESIKSHPNLDEILFAYVDSILPRKSGITYSTKIISTEPRYISGNSVISYYFQRYELLGIEGISLTEFHTASMCKNGLISRNRIQGLIDLLRSAGLVEIKVSEIDRRSRLLLFTEKYKALIKQYIHASLLSVDRLTGTSYAERVANDDYGFIGRHFGHEVIQHVNTKSFSELFPNYAFLFQATAGPEFLRLMWHRSMQGDKIQANNIETSIAYISRELGISFAHARGLVVKAQEANLLTRISKDTHLFKATDNCLNLFRNVRCFELSLIIQAAEKAKDASNTTI